MSSSEASMARTRSATRGWCSIDSTMMCCHCSAVDWSIRVNVMGQLSPSRGSGSQQVEDGGGGDRPVVGRRVGSVRTGAAGQEAQHGAHGAQELAELGGRRE